MNKEVLATESAKQVNELCEDIEVVGPGFMLSEARKKLSLSTEDISKRLNFRRNLVDEIEQDIFDPLVPATFNRGYLRNYAKIVALDVDEVLRAYDMLGVAKQQRNEMQSFSHLTIKQAEHSRLMWFSYLIVALLVGLMVLWWLQDTKLSVTLFDDQKQKQEINNDASDVADLNIIKKNAEAPKLSKPDAIELNEITKPVVNVSKVLESVVAKTELALNTKPDTNTEPVPDISTVVFTFLGDCWVNVYDATDERIAWGVKKSGYVMAISGKAPLKVTLGKPELAEITFNGKQVDMSSFNVGNIAKFTLPLSS